MQNGRSGSTPGLPGKEKHSCQCSLVSRRRKEIHRATGDDGQAKEANRNRAGTHRPSKAKLPPVADTDLRRARSSGAGQPHGDL
jgi:hypothetical protein